MSELTGYKTAQFINEMIANVNARENASLKAIPPQMIYNYMRKNYIAKNSNGLIDVTEAERFANAYIAKKLAKLANA